MSINIPDPATIEFQQENYDPVTGDSWLEPKRLTSVSGLNLGQDNITEEGPSFFVGFDDFGDPDARSGFWSSTPFAQGDSDDIVVNGSGSIVIRPLDPRDAISQSQAKVPQPLAVLRAAALGNGEALATELSAVVAGDNTVATLLLDTGLGTYVRYSGDWQLLSPESTSLDDMLIVQVGPGAVDVWDAAESSRSAVQVSDLPISVPGGDDVMPLAIPVDTGEGDGAGLAASGVMIPPIESVDDLDLGMRFASIHPGARWYVAKRAEALGAGAKIPSDWKSSGVVRPFPTRVEQLDADVGTRRGVLAAARRFSALCAAGLEPEAPAYTQLMQAAARLELSEAPDVLTAARWQDWLHPRGMDGRFIEVKQFVDVFAQPGGKKALRDPQADRRRGRITGLFPQGANVEYFDTSGKPIAADPAAGYPSTIPQNQIRQRISSAPNSSARLTSVSSRDEFKADLHEAMTQDEYDQAVAEFNKTTVAGLHPERSAAVHGGAEPVTDEEYFAHAGFISDVTNAGLAKQADGGAGLGAESALKDSYGRWGQEQLDRMMEMTGQLYQRATAGKPKDRKALFIGGLPGSGKTTLLDELDAQGAITKADWVVIDPDQVRDELIKAGWYPHIDGLTPNETSGFIHAQASEMAYMMERLSMKDGYNLIYDTTMGGHGNWLGETMDHLAAYQYATPDGIFIDSLPDHAKGSIAARHRAGLDKYRTGKSGLPGDPEVDNGGRYVPDSVVEAMSGEAGKSTNLTNFERMKEKFGNWATFNENNEPGTKPNPVQLDGTPGFLHTPPAAAPTPKENSARPTYDEKGEIVVTPAARYLAQQVYDRAVQNEPEISSRLTEMVGGDGTFYGWDFRLKAVPSLAEKIERSLEWGPGNPPDRQQAADDIRDSVRYTVHFKEDVFVDKSQAMIDKLRAENKDIRVRNTWGVENAEYRGINVSVTTPDGLVYEVQFHTPSSQAVKDANHADYEKQRAMREGTPEYRQLTQQMINRSNQLPMLPGIGDIGVDSAGGGSGGGG